MADYFTVSGDPAESSDIDSSVMRAELASIATGFTKVAGYTGNASKAVIINSGATAQTVTTGTLALAGNFATSGAFACTLTVTAATNVTLPTTGTLATRAGTESLSNKTLVSPTITTSPTAAGATWADLGSVTTIDINGGTINGITDLAVVDGGTGSSTAADARTALGLAIGSDVQAYDATLLSIATLGTAADKIAYTTGVDTWAETAITAAGRAILDDTTAAAQATTLGLGTGNSPQFTGIELGHATDTTLARSAAGRVTIEGVGVVKGPASSTDNAVARFDSTTGELVQNSGVIIDDSNNITGVAALTATGIITGLGMGWVAISSQTASSSATIDFTSGLDDTYDHYMIAFENVKPATDDVYFGLRIGTGAGPSWQAGAGAYGWGARTSGPGGGADDGSAIAPSVTTLIALSRTTGVGQGVGNAAGEHITGVVEFSNPDAADWPLFKYRSAYMRSDALPQSFDGAGDYGAATAITGIRFLFSSGNIASGTFRLYGLKKS